MDSLQWWIALVLIQLWAAISVQKFATSVFIVVRIAIFRAANGKHWHHSPDYVTRWEAQWIHSPFEVLKVWSTRLHGCQNTFQSNNANDLKPITIMKQMSIGQYFLHHSQPITRSKMNFWNILLNYLHAKNLSLEWNWLECSHTQLSMD